MTEKLLFTTSRSLIRPFVRNDYDALFELMSDPDVMKYTGFKTPQSKDRVSDLLDIWINEGKKPFGVWCAEEKDAENLIGWFMLKNTVSTDPELGFMLEKNYWHRGYATEIASAFLDYADKKLKIKKVIASTVAENFASIKVLEKIGMSRSKNQSNKDLIYYEWNKK